MRFAAALLLLLALAPDARACGCGHRRESSLGHVFRARHETSRDRGPAHATPRVVVLAAALGYALAGRRAWRWRA